MTLALEHLTVPNSHLARWDARWKLASLLIAAAVAAMVRHPIVATFALLFASLLILVARLPGRWLAPRIGSVAFALMPLLVVLPLTSEGGMTAAVTLFLRGLTVTMFALVLIGTAPLSTTLHAAQRLWFPGLLIQLTLMSYRYVFLIAEEFARLRTALRVRGFRNHMNRHSYRTIGRVTGAMLVRGHDRAERVGHAMRCRGFDGTFRSIHDFRTTITDILMFFLVIIITTGIAVADWEMR